MKEQETRPRTIGHALADSPVAQAAWIHEKFHDWTDRRGAPESEYRFLSDPVWTQSVRV